MFYFCCAVYVEHCRAYVVHNDSENGNDTNTAAAAAAVADDDDDGATNYLPDDQSFVMLVGVYSNSMASRDWLFSYVNRLSAGASIGVGDGGGRQGHAPPQKKLENIFFGQLLCKFGHFSSNNHVKYGNFVNFSYIFCGKNVLSCPLKLTELLRLWRP